MLTKNLFSFVIFLPSRRGRSVQHSYRKHSGCGEAGGRVFQNEECEPPQVHDPQYFACCLHLL